MHKTNTNLTFVVEHGYDVAVSGRGNSLATGTYKKFRIESTFGNLIGHKPKEESTGFPDLQELSLGISTRTNWMLLRNNERDIILRLLKTSEKLRLLDLRGWMDSTAITCLEHLPATDLHHLYLGHSAVIAYHNFHSCISKWRHSLTDLDLSGNDFRDGVLQSALDALCQPPAPAPLQNLNLAGTPVNMSQLKTLLDSLPELHTLDLTSCREVARGYKREYRTRKDIQKLKSSLKH